jgi:glycosidase
MTLATIPEEEWQLLAHRGFDFVWLMGVWQRSPDARQEALRNQNLRQEFNQVLPDWTEEDVAGSPYAVYAYTLDPALGNPDDLTQLKARLNRLGISLILDFVPNHLAIDHPWTLTHPGWFVRVDEAEAHAHPDWYFSPVADIYLAHVKDPNFPPWNDNTEVDFRAVDLAHGRDPYFPPWTDTAQVNFNSNNLRQAMIDELLKIAEVADGVRCDMAMLALNDVFGQIWGNLSGDHPRPGIEFWTQAIERVKQKRPDFLFIAEAYWRLERRLQKLGFDYTYDKVLYDRLRFSNSGEIRGYLATDQPYQSHSVHFIENHDEPRAVIVLGRERSLAAATIIATIPGLRLFHNGQFEGKRIHMPVQLVREPEENADPQIMQFYERLLGVSATPAFHEGDWKLLEVNQAWAGNESHHNLLAWVWQYQKQYKIVVVNYSAVQAQGRLKLSLPDITTDRCTFHDELNDEIYLRDLNEVRNQGLYIDLHPYHSHLLDTVTG